MSTSGMPPTISGSFVEHKYILTCWLVARGLQEGLGSVDTALGIISAMRLGAGWMVRHLLERVAETDDDDVIRLGIAMQLSADPSTETEAMLTELLIAGPVPSAQLNRLSYYQAQALNTAGSHLRDVPTLLKLTADCQDRIFERDLARREIEICGQDLGWSTDILNESAAINEMASHLLNQSAYDDVLMLAALATAASPKHIPADDQDLLSLRASSAEALRRSGQVVEAHDANADLLDDLTQQERTTDEIYRVVLNNQAHVCQALGEHSEARSLGRQLIDAELAQDPRDELALAIAENFLGMCETRLGDGPKAVKRFKASLGYWEAASQADNYGCGLAHHNLAGALESVGDLSGAIKHAERALDILEAAKGRGSEYTIEARSALDGFRNKLHRQLNGEGRADPAQPGQPSTLRELRRGREDQNPGYINELISVLDSATVQNDISRLEVFAPEARRLLDASNDLVGERVIILLQVLLHAEVLTYRHDEAREIAERIEMLLATGRVAPEQNKSAARAVGVFHAVFGDPFRAATYLADASEQFMSQNLTAQLITSMPHVRAGVLRASLHLIGLLARVLIDLGKDAPEQLKQRLLRILLRQNIQERTAFLIRAGSTAQLRFTDNSNDVLELREVNEALRRATLFHPGYPSGGIPNSETVASLQSGCVSEVVEILRQRPPSGLSGA